MKTGWQTKALGEILQDTETVNPLRSPETEFDYIDVSSISNTTFQIEETQRLTGKAAPSRARKLVKANDVLFATVRPTLRRIAIVPEQLDNQVCSTGYFVLRPKAEIDHRFIFYSLFTEDFMEQMEILQKGASYPAVTDGQVRAQSFSFPPLPEQQRIVGILDEAFEAIVTAQANVEKSRQNTHALFASYLQSVLRSKKWKWKTLGDLCDGVEYGSSAKSKTEGKVPVLRMGNIQDAQLDWENLVYTDDEDEIAKYLLKHNDVLFNRTNSPELVGKTAIYKSEMPAIFAGYLIRINRKEDLLDGDFLNYFLNSQIALDYGKTVVISSVNQANINGAKLKGYPIPAPSLAEQRIIVAKLDSLREETQRLGRLYERKLATLEALKKSLLYRAFTGQLHDRVLNHDGEGPL